MNKLQECKDSLKNIVSIIIIFIFIKTDYIVGKKNIKFNYEPGSVPAFT